MKLSAPRICLVVILLIGAPIFGISQAGASPSGGGGDGGFGSPAYESHASASGSGIVLGARFGPSGSSSVSAGIDEGGLPRASVDSEAGSNSPSSSVLDEDLQQEILRQFAVQSNYDDRLAGGVNRSTPSADPGNYSLIDLCAGGSNADACEERESCTLPDGSQGQNLYVEYAEPGAEAERATRPICSPADQVPEDDEPMPLPVFTVEDLRRLEVSPAVTAVEPAPDTLVGLHTNMYASAEDQVFDTELAGFPVQVRVTPVSFTWDYGDGTTFGPTELSGGPLPAGSWDEPTDTSHQYADTGDVSVVLTTEFAGEYSVSGGPWLPVDGTSTVSSDPVALSVWRSTVRNYADDCFDNPGGVGC